MRLLLIADTKKDSQKNDVVAITICMVIWEIQKDYNILQLSIQYVVGMMLPYFVVAVLNALIIIQMAKYRRLRAGMSANVDSKSDDSAQR